MNFLRLIFLLGFVLSFGSALSLAQNSQSDAEQIAKALTPITENLGGGVKPELNAQALIAESNGQETNGSEQTGTDKPKVSQTRDKSGPDTPPQVTPEGTSKDRLFYALPNFLTLEGSKNVPPLTTKEKFKVVTKGSFDPVQFVWYGFLSGISQAENSEPGYGQGMEGYGKRYGAYFADGTIENYFTGAILPSIFRQDPRFFQSGRGSFWDRTGYAMSRIVVTRGDSGRSEFNVSEVLGSAMSAAISTYSYHPKSDRTLSNTASVWGSQVGYDTITLVVKEFWPDIRRKIKKEPKPVTH